MAVGGRESGDLTESSYPVVRLKVTGVHRLLAFGTLLLSVACGGDKEPAGPSGTTQPVIASIVVSSASVTLDRWGDTVSLVVRGLNAGGHSFPPSQRCGVRLTPPWRMSIRMV